MFYLKCKCLKFCDFPQNKKRKRNLIKLLSIFSPSSNLNSKQIVSEDGISGEQNSSAITVSSSSNNRPTLQRDDSSIASGSSGFGSLTKKKPEKPDFYSNEMDPATFISSIVTDSGVVTDTSDNVPTYSIVECTTSNSNNTQIPPITNHQTMLPVSQQQQQQQQVLGQSNCSPSDIGHSRNSSNTSQVSSNLHKIYLNFDNDLIINCRCPKDPVIVVFHIVNTLDKVRKGIPDTRGKAS